MFWNELSDPLLESYNASFENGELTVSQRQAIITLLEKKGKESNVYQKLASYIFIKFRL